MCDFVILSSCLGPMEGPTTVGDTSVQQWLTEMLKDSYSTVRPQPIMPQIIQRTATCT